MGLGGISQYCRDTNINFCEGPNDQMSQKPTINEMSETVDVCRVLAQN